MQSKRDVLQSGSRYRLLDRKPEGAENFKTLQDPYKAENQSQSYRRSAKTVQQIISMNEQRPESMPHRGRAALRIKEAG